MNEASEKVNKPLLIEVGKTVEEARKELEQWLSDNCNLNQISLERVSSKVLPDLKLFQQKQVRFIFDVGTQEPTIDKKGEITVFHPNIPREEGYPKVTLDSSHGLQTGYGIKEALPNAIKGTQVYDGDIDKILAMAMKAWDELPPVPLKFPVTFTYDTETKKVMMKGNNRETQYDTVPQINQQVNEK